MLGFTLSDGWIPGHYSDIVDGVSIGTSLSRPQATIKMVGFFVRYYLHRCESQCFSSQDEAKSMSAYYRIPE